MAVSVSFFGLVCILAAALLPLPSNPQAPTPHLGDIRLVPCTNEPLCIPSDDTVIGTLNVYFYQNIDMNVNLVFKPICNDFKQVYDGEDKNIGITAVCKMLGYEVGEEVPSDSNMGFPSYPDDSYALTNVDCTIGNPTHILRCAHRISTECPHGAFHLKCSERKISKSSLFPHPSVDGTVQLCPPDQTLNSPDYPNVQISMGLISVAHDNYYGPINEQPNTVRFGTYEANSICQQLGFTGSVSESTRTVGSYDGLFTFNTCFNQHVHKSSVRLTTKVANKCAYSSCPCFSNCYDFKGKDCTPPPGGTCSQENNLVIECSFDLSEVPPPAGTNDPYVQCTDQCGLSESLKDGAIGFFVLALVIVIIGFSIVVFILIWKIRKFKRQGYENLPGRNNLGANNHDQNVNNEEHEE